MSQRFDPLLRELIPAFGKSFVRILDPDFCPKLVLRNLKFHRDEYFLPNPRGGPPRRPDLVAKIRARDGEELLLHVELENQFRSARIHGILDYNHLLRLNRSL